MSAAVETQTDAPVTGEGPLFKVTWLERGTLRSADVEAPTAAAAAFDVAKNIGPKHAPTAVLFDVTRLR